MFENWANKLKEKKQQVNSESEITFKTYNAGEAIEPKPQVREEEKENTRASSAVVSQNPDSNIELKVVRPESFSEVSDIADYLIDGCTVVLNVEVLDRASTMRMLDFLNGVTYTKDGEIKKVSQSTYIITPSGIGISDED